MRLTVLGAGLAGSTLTRVAREAGHEVTLVSDGGPTATNAAIALLRSTHLGADKERLAPSIAAWERWGLTVRKGGLVSRWNRLDAVPVYQSDWYAVEPVGADLTPDTDYDPGMATADAVVLCDGQGAGRRTYGATWVNPDPNALGDLLRLHHLAPYRVLAATSFPSGCRLGSASASDLPKAIAQAEQFMAAAVDLGWTTREGWSLVTGTRLLRRDRLEQIGPRCWRWSGFHRTGFGIVPHEAGDVLARIGATA